MELATIYEVKSIEKSGAEISACITFNKYHKVFEGHFPDNPIVPGVVQVQVMKDLLESVFRKMIFLNRVKSIKFTNVLSPLEVKEVNFNFVIESHFENNLWVKCIVKTKTKVYMKYSGNALVSDKK